MGKPKKSTSTDSPSCDLMAHKTPGRGNRIAVIIPNATTARAMQSADRLKGKKFRTTAAFFRSLGI
jgi:hypothetical protein